MRGMGFSSGTLYHLTWLLRDGHLPRRARYLDLGSQNIAGPITESEARRAFTLVGRADAFDGELLREGRKAADLLTALGFDYLAFDTYSAGRTCAFDLNTKRLSWWLRGTFDIVANCGTSEHVANQFNVFKVMHEALRPNGVAYNHVPFFGYIDHGLVGYHPRFFAALIAGNGYRPLFWDFSHHFRCGYDTYKDISSVPGGATWEGRDVGGALMNVVWQKTTAARYRPPVDGVLKGDINVGIPSVNEIMARAPPWQPLQTM